MAAEVRDTVRLAAVADLHCGRAAQGALQPVFAQASEGADALLLAGDLTDYGLPEEARVLAREVTAAVKVPTIAVLGNHDYESGKADEVRQILTDAGITVLDGDVTEVRGVGIAGVKGFAGGFGERALQAWGEDVIKAFVREALEEALKLEKALARLRMAQRVALLHYAPVQDTVMGEPPEIFPFLGSSRLEEPINRYRVCAVVHGHAHRGQPTGRTAAGVPVYNAAMPLLRRLHPDRPPFVAIDIPVTPGEGADGSASGNGDAAAVAGARRG